MFHLRQVSYNSQQITTLLEFIVVLSRHKIKQSERIAEESKRKMREKVMENTMMVTKKESKLQKMFGESDPKTEMILNAVIAAIWAFCAIMSYHSVVTYNSSRISLYIDGFLALFYVGMTFGYAIKYSKAKKEKKNEVVA